VVCPWHAFEFEVTSGRCLNNPNLQIPCFPVKVEGQDILVQV
jgi:nitrite reductase/ring-hydroxylating ferredoxin subunit